MDSHGDQGTEGTTADCTQVCQLIERIDAQNLLADRGYDADFLIEKAREMNMNVVIPPKSNHKTIRAYDKHLYKLTRTMDKDLL